MEKEKYSAFPSVRFENKMLNSCKYKNTLYIHSIWRVAMKCYLIFSIFLTVFRNLLGTEESPTKVLEVRSDNYLSRPIHYRNDSILLYGPKLPPDSKNSKDKYYEIVLHKPFTESLHQMYRSVGHRLFLYSTINNILDLVILRNSLVIFQWGTIKSTY